MRRDIQEQRHNSSRRSSRESKESPCGVRLPRSQHRATLGCLALSLSTLREVLKMMKQGQRNPLTCPVCGSSVRRTRSQLDGWVLPERYYCESCNYVGFVALDRDPEEEPKVSETQ